MFFAFFSKKLLFSFILFCGPLWLARGASGTNLLCESDEFCQKEFNPHYVCDSFTNTCNRALLAASASLESVLGVLFIFCANLLSFSMGVSANGILFPILVLVFGYIAKDSLSTIKMANLLVAAVNFVFVLSLRNKANGNRLYIDFELVLFLIPLVLVGSMFGSLSFALLPGVFTYSLIFVVMVLISIKNFIKVLQVKREFRRSLPKGSFQSQLVAKDTINRLPEALAQNTGHKPHGFEASKCKTVSARKTNPAPQSPVQFSAESFPEEHTARPKPSIRPSDCRFTVQIEEPCDSEAKTQTSWLSSEQLAPEKEPLPSVLGQVWEKKGVLFLVLVAFMVMVFANFGKGSGDRASIFNFEQCSFFSISFYVACMLPLLLIAYLGVLKLRQRSSLPASHSETKMGLSLSIKVGLSSVLGGFVSTMGVSGSLCISTFLILLGIEPLVVKCTMSLMLLIMAMNNSFQFFFMGYFDWKNILTLAAVSALGCLLANLFIKKQLSKHSPKKANLAITICCFAMTLLLCFVLPVSSYVEYLFNHDFLVFKATC